MARGKRGAGTAGAWDDKTEVFQNGQKVYVVPGDQQRQGVRKDWKKKLMDSAAPGAERLCRIIP